ncbi:hypothetical protein EV356DRAFT_530909 [Viridothelium virens]|uniref:Uncharacterized protein n=1 Tax=Viridothelium virens TaxID=1048519 RepID=A0A6A6HES6_VIRVR|nr:hypothetical protein EV356DRAFT_530909 [Viridothelium virens]
MRPPHMETSESSLTSVTLLPSSPIYVPPSHLASKRPKLTLNTGRQRLYAKGLTSLRLETLSAVSPTVRNTFCNTFASPDSPVDSGLSESCSNLPAPPQVEDFSTDAPNNSATPTSSSTASSADGTPVRIPYQQPHNLVSILSNSLVPRIDSRRMSFSRSRPLFPATKHVSFRNPLAEEIQTEKYTLAHSDLDSASSSTISSLCLSTDVLPAGQMPGSITHCPSGLKLSSQSDASHISISTSSSMYDTSRPSLHLQRLDTGSTITERPPSLSGSSSSPEFTFSLPSPREDTKHDSLEPVAPAVSTPKLSPRISTLSTSGPSLGITPVSPRSSPVLSNLSNSPRTGEKRDSSSSEDDDEDEESERDTRAMYPSTPIAGRRKRRREWVWTLEPLPGMKPEVHED